MDSFSSSGKLSKILGKNSLLEVKHLFYYYLTVLGQTKDRKEKI